MVQHPADLGAMRLDECSELGLSPESRTWGWAQDGRPTSDDSHSGRVGSGPGTERSNSQYLADWGCIQRQVAERMS